MSLGQAEVWLNVIDTDDPWADISDVISRHPPGSWPDDVAEIIEERPPGWQGTGFDVVERPPPGEPSPYWYQVGPGGLFYWQWAALGAGAVLLVALSGDGRRRR